MSRRTGAPPPCPSSVPEVAQRRGPEGSGVGSTRQQCGSTIRSGSTMRDTADPLVLAAGANDEIDVEACAAGNPASCPFTPGVGVSGIYFSLDGGATWTQPTYSGWSARQCGGPAACQPAFGPIGTLPWYYEH